MLKVDWKYLESLVQPLPYSLWNRLMRSPETTRLRDYGYRESAMKALNTAQKSVLDSVLAEYSHNDAELSNTLKSLSTYLLASTSLSEDYVAGLNGVQKQVYYGDIFHTAYRALIRPPLYNLWISPCADHAKMDHLGKPQATHFSEAHLKTIAAIWKALNDENFPLEEGYTHARAKELFAETLSDIGRAHNRDNDDKQDDMKADNPSCEQGINQRLVQFMMVTFRQEMLDADLMKQKFQEHFVSENQNGQMTVFDKIEELDLDVLYQMSEALESLIVTLENTPEEEQLLSQLFPWTTLALVGFIETCKARYGADYFNRKLANPVCFQEKKFDNFGCLILRLARDPLSVYCGEIRFKIDNKIKRLSQEAETEQLKARLINLAMEENQETLVYQLLDGSPDFVREVAAQYQARQEAQDVANIVKKSRRKRSGSAVGNKFLERKVLTGRRLKEGARDAAIGAIGGTVIASGLALGVATAPITLGMMGMAATIGGSVVMLGKVVKSATELGLHGMQSAWGMMSNRIAKGNPEKVGEERDAFQNPENEGDRALATTSTQRTVTFSTSTDSNKRKMEKTEKLSTRNTKRVRTQQFST